MAFLEQKLEFRRLDGHALPVYEATVTAEELVTFAKAVESAEQRLVALWGSDERDRDPENGFALHAAFDLAEGLVCLTLPLATEKPEFPDLSGIFYTAARMQRTVRDMLGIKSDGGDQRPWLRHANWPEDYFPLRRDTEDTQFEAHNEDYAIVQVEGEGVHEIAVGPIHAGIIEPGHFRFSVMGENVLRLEERLGWKHKGIERRFVGMRVEEGAKLAGRVSGDSTVAYAWAYSQAAEAIAGVAPPARAYWLRALMLESERIANHLGDLGYLGNDVALSFGLMQFMRLKEDWVRLNAEAFGHRYLMDCIVPGGVSVDLDEKSALDFVSMTEKFEREVRSLKVIYDEHAGLQDRFLTTGRIVPKTARRLGMIGLAGRASGQIWDLRSNHPFKPYDKLSPKVSISRSGDVAGRANVRFAEVFESLSLIRKIIIEMPKGHYRSELKIRPEHKGFGWVEGWRGDILVALETDTEGNIRRCHCHDPSWQNWLAIEHAVIDNIVPDFPLINKSFNLSYSGPDL